MALAEKVKEIVAERLGVDIEKITPQARFIEDLGADSLDITELIMGLEENFNLQISDEEVQQLLTVQDVIDYLKNHQVKG